MGRWHCLCHLRDLRCMEQQQAAYGRAENPLDRCCFTLQYRYGNNLLPHPKAIKKNATTL